MPNEDFRLITVEMERLRERVLSRVRMVRRVRAFFASPYSSALFVLAFLLCASTLVSLGDVVHNIMVHAEWGGRFSYTYDALIHARIMVQILAGLTSFSLFILVTKILFKLRTPVYSIGNFISHYSFRLFRP